MEFTKSIDVYYVTDYSYIRGDDALLGVIKQEPEEDNYWCFTSPRGGVAMTASQLLQIAKYTIRLNKGEPMECEQ